ATRQESRAALPLHLLGQRFGVLAGSPAFDAERIPLGPRALCRAMRDASQTLQVPYEARLLLYRTFDRLVMVGYARVLERLDEAMDAAGVLPGLTFVPVRTRATARGGQETDGKPESAARATVDAHGSTSASAGDGGGGGGSDGSGGGGGGGASGGAAGSASSHRDGDAGER